MTSRLRSVSGASRPLSGATPEPLLDGEWMQRFRAGDEAALRQAFDRYGGMVHRVGLLRLGNHHDAEDLVQQVFVRAHHHCAGVRHQPPRDIPAGVLAPTVLDDAHPARQERRGICRMTRIPATNRGSRS